MQTQITSAELKVSINFFGAEISSVKNNGLEYIWQADKAVWARHTPVLFPIVGKLKDNVYTYNTNKYELPQHGFARDLEFKLTDKKENTCTFELRSNAATKKIYPFDFVFEIKYILDQNILTTNYNIKNPSREQIFFSVGAHPGFNCPFLPNSGLEDHYLEFEKNSFLQTQLNNGLRSDAKKELILKDKKLFIIKELFDNDALVFENNQVNKVSLCSTKSNHKITMLCKDWPYFGIWSKKGSNNFICLEPWYGISDHEATVHDLTKKEGIIKLAPNTDFNCAFSLIFS